MVASSINSLFVVVESVNRQLGALVDDIHDAATAEDAIAVVDRSKT